jgi:beta-galactosidase
MTARLAGLMAALAILIAQAPLALGAEPDSQSHTFAIGTNDFLLDGHRFQIRCGEIHAARVPREYWHNRLQMAKAMGLNTVCAYLFWNQIEPRQGEFDWSGQADLVEFCRLAYQEGLWVILRPGPYSCAEWEMGGLPWWLLKDDIRLRTRDPRYMDAAKKYLNEVGRLLAPLQINHPGGPIIMVQVENEYGFYGQDSEYMGELRQALKDSGFTVPLFACNPPYHLKDGYRADLFPVVNFGSDPAGGFKALRQILPQGPLMCGEFYPGWFDTWGAPHHRGDTPRYLADLRYMLEHGESFSIYMAHGGTTFGLWSGADRPFKPDTSSYDYDAPISEAGWPTEKFYKTRELFSQFLLPGETIPDPPATNPVISIAPVEVTECAPVLANLPAPIEDMQPRTMEKYDQGHGCILYRTEIPKGPAGTLHAAAIHDFGFVYLDGNRVGIMDRRNGNFKVELPERAKPATLDILVEAMGRVNFGQEAHDRKGIHAPVTLDGAELTGWQIFTLPLDRPMLDKLKYGPPKTNCPAFWRATVNVNTPGDTFLDMTRWGKGVVWINGHCLGRYWNIGPTQTAYAPGCWLRAGGNEIVILDLIGPQKRMIANLGNPIFFDPEKRLVAGLDHPILGELFLAKDFSRSRRAILSLQLDSATPTLEAQFAPGGEMQEVKFAGPATGHFFCLESRSAFDGRPFAAVAELDLLDQSGKPLSHEGWTIAYVDSEERDREDGTAENAIDGQTANFWHTEWGYSEPGHPHRLVIDLGAQRTITGFRYVPRQDNSSGRIKDYRIYVGDNIVK